MKHRQEAKSLDVYGVFLHDSFWSVSLLVCVFCIEIRQGTASNLDRGAHLSTASSSARVLVRDTSTEHTSSGVRSSSTSASRSSTPAASTRAAGLATVALAWLGRSLSRPRRLSWSTDDALDAVLWDANRRLLTLKLPVS